MVLDRHSTGLQISSPCNVPAWQTTLCEICSTVWSWQLHLIAHRIRFARSPMLSCRVFNRSTCEKTSQGTQFSERMNFRRRMESCSLLSWLSRQLRLHVSSWNGNSPDTKVNRLDGRTTILLDHSRNGELILVVQVFGPKRAMGEEHEHH